MDIQIIQATSDMDPVFARFGQAVYSYNYIERLRDENLKLKSSGQSVYNLIPQRGMQENILNKDADFIICGAVRGVGKTWIGLFFGLQYIDNPMATLYGFRKVEDDIKRSIWESSKLVYTGFGTPLESSYEWKFPSGARMKMEQLYNAKTVRERFRGAEQPFMLVEELQEYTVENMNLIFTLIGSNRNTIGAKNRFVATCNPVGKSNALRGFLGRAGYISDETDLVIPEMDGKIRFFFRYGTGADQIAWGDTKEEVYEDYNAKQKIDKICKKTKQQPLSLITSLCFMQGAFCDNKVLQVSDKDYMAKLMAQGDETSEKDVLGLWRDTEDNGGNVIPVRKVLNMFEAKTENRNGFHRASADVALEGDFLVLMAFDGWHLMDVYAIAGIDSSLVVSIIKDFLKRNDVREENFTYDSNGLGLWLKGYFKTSKQFNNKARSNNPNVYANLKSECAYTFQTNMKNDTYSVDESLVKKKFKDKDGNSFTLRDILCKEIVAVSMKEQDSGRFEIIQKSDMKKRVGHSPDFIECFFMVEHIDMTVKVFSRKGFEAYC